MVTRQTTPETRAGSNRARVRAADAKAQKPVEKKKESALEFIASIASVLVVGLFIITFNLQAFEIPSSSMENTLLIGDHVFVDRIRFAPQSNWLGPFEAYRPIRRGDIVVFLHPDPRQAGTYVVKRIIGIPGDHIRLKEGVVYRNGEKLNEPYLIHSMGNYDPYRDEFPSVTPEMASVIPEWQLTMRNYIHDGELVVPPGRYFAMGDNRDVSYDSRYWGFIPQENLIGRPLFIYWSFETPEDQWQKSSVSDRVAFIGRIVVHFFDQTRWRRTLRLVH